MALLRNLTLLIGHLMIVIIFSLEALGGGTLTLIYNKMKFA